MTESAWCSVVNCAVSNSLRRRGWNNGEALPETELDSIRRYLQKNENLATEEIKAVIETSISRAQEQVLADGKSPTWAKVGVAIGVSGIVFDLVAFILTGFSFIFLIFLIVSCSIISPCLKCISEQKRMCEAARIWNKARKTGNAKQMDAALQKMEAVFCG